MKAEDIERLKSICEENGFEIKSESQSGLIYYIDKKDPWDGVEFAKCKAEYKNCFTYGKIYPILEIDGMNIEFKYDDEGDENGSSTTFFNPSSESEYVEQLKKEAFERFGEIKEGDRFIGVQEKSDKEICSHPNWVYHKEFDLLCYGGITLYQSGKWATNLPEMVKVEYIKSSKINLMSNFTFKIKGVSGYNPNIIGDFLAQQLKNYLNDNQE